MEAEVLRPHMRRVFEEDGIEVIFGTEDTSHALWNSTLDQMGYIPTPYLSTSLDYQHAYMECFLDEIIDVSVIFKIKERVLGLWPLSINSTKKGVEVRTNQGAVLPPIFIKNTSEKVMRKIDRACLSALDSLCSLIGCNDSGTWQSEMIFFDGMLSGANRVWYRLLMEKAATAHPFHELYVDLALSPEEIHRRWRKSYRSLIQEGERLFDVTVHETVTPSLFDEFRQLHFHVAGRATRSLETWEIQEEAIRAGCGFLVTARQKDGELIGAEFYEYSRDEAVYSVAAYRRDLFDQPISHVIHNRAIQHMQALGLNWYHIGTRAYPGDMIKPTDKELSISYFKEGVATHTFFRMILDVPADDFPLEKD